MRKSLAWFFIAITCLLLVLRSILGMLSLHTVHGFIYDATIWIEISWYGLSLSFLLLKKIYENTQSRYEAYCKFTILLAVAAIYNISVANQNDKFSQFFLFFLMTLSLISIKLKFWLLKKKKI